jgi:hypothetical protein
MKKWERYRLIRSRQEDRQGGQQLVLGLLRDLQQEQEQERGQGPVLVLVLVLVQGLAKSSLREQNKRWGW